MTQQLKSQIKEKPFRYLKKLVYLDPCIMLVPASWKTDHLPTKVKKVFAAIYQDKIIIQPLKNGGK